MKAAGKEGCCMAVVSVRTMLEVKDGQVFDKTLQNVQPVQYYHASCCSLSLPHYFLSHLLFCLSLRVHFAG